MDVKREIKKFSAPEDKKILLGLFERYHWESQWRFVAKCRLERYGKLSFQTNRVWFPTEEGKILYKHLIQI